jgi:D-alanine-D-alanine ligase
MRRLRVLVLVHPELIPPESLKGYSEEDIHAWKTEYDVTSTLRASGHKVEILGVQYELRPIRDKIESWKPHIVFNLLEEFHGETVFDQNVVSYLELLRIPYTGCNPRGLMLARGKDLAKKLLAYHRVPMPAFAVFPKRRAIRKPANLRFPLIVKSLDKDASRGIAQASVVEDEARLAERIGFIHETIGTSAIAEQYIEGREVYVGVLGNDRRRVLPVWELSFGKMSAGAWRIATEKVKHDIGYQERLGILQGPAEAIAPPLVALIQNTVKRICRTLELDGYARVDFRLSDDGVPYFIEANPNPEIAESEEFAQAALYDGLSYPAMLDRILALGLQRAREAGIG